MEPSAQVNDHRNIDRQVSKRLGQIDLTAQGVERKVRYMHYASNECGVGTSSVHHQGSGNSVMWRVNCLHSTLLHRDTHNGCMLTYDNASCLGFVCYCLCH